MTFYTLPHLVPLVSLKGLEFQIHRWKQRSMDNSCYVEAYQPLCRLQGDKAFTFLVDLSRKNRKYCKSGLLDSTPDSWRNTPRPRVSSQYNSEVFSS